MKTVLIIDDDPAFRKLIGEILKHHGWSVSEAEQGEAGIEMARQLHPQVVLCDLLMPRCNGFQVCRALRGDPALRTIRIIIATGRNFETDKRAALDAGADEYLAKPIVPTHLMEVLSRLIKDGNGNGNEGFVRTTGPARFKFWGVRGSIPTPGPGTVKYGGNTSCIEVRVGGELIILDAGTGLRPLGISLLNEFKDQPLNLTLLLTHTHWDHIQGLPFFPPIYRPQNRLRILGYEGARTSLHNVLSGQMESPYFPVTFGELPGNVEIEELRDMSFSVGPVHVESFFANHPGICVGYRIFSPEGSLAFFPD
ncbi:MAG TPA: response regulator, partial [Verrucomicrobiae bacterium]|nr:response regulator [Verrucomicrobiae bacterium]